MDWAKESHQLAVDDAYLNGDLKNRPRSKPVAVVGNPLQIPRQVYRPGYLLKKPSTWQ